MHRVGRAFGRGEQVGGVGRAAFHQEARVAAEALDATRGVRREWDDEPQSRRLAEGEGPLQGLRKHEPARRGLNGLRRDRLLGQYHPFCPDLRGLGEEVVVDSLPVAADLGARVRRRAEGLESHVRPRLINECDLHHRCADVGVVRVGETRHFQPRAQHLTPLVEREANARLGGVRRGPEAFALRHVLPRLPVSGRLHREVQREAEVARSRVEDNLRDRLRLRQPHFEPLVLVVEGVYVRGPAMSGHGLGRAISGLDAVGDAHDMPDAALHARRRR